MKTKINIVNSELRKRAVYDVIIPKIKHWTVALLLVELVLLCWFSHINNCVNQFPSFVINQKMEMHVINSVSLKRDALLQKKNVPIVKTTGLWNGTKEATNEQIMEEDRLGEMELLAQIAQAEAGNQGVEGMRFVISVVLNRVRSPKFPNTIEEVIFQSGAFGPVTDGNWEKAAWNMSPDAFEAVRLEIEEGQIDTGVLYFNTKWDNGSHPFRIGAHWFSY